MLSHVLPEHPGRQLGGSFDLCYAATVMICPCDRGGCALVRARLAGSPHLREGADDPGTAAGRFRTR